MYPKEEKSAALMSETIREMLTDKGLMESLLEAAAEDPDFKKPLYWDALSEKNGISAMVMAMMLKAMTGDTAAFTALSKYGFGEKVQVDTSDFYKANKIEIEVVKSNVEGLDENNSGATPANSLGDGRDSKADAKKAGNKPAKKDSRNNSSKSK